MSFEAEAAVDTGRRQAETANPCNFCSVPFLTKQGEGVSYGQYWCNASYAFVGWDNPETVDDLNCLTAYTEGRYQLDGCVGAAWTVSFTVF